MDYHSACLIPEEIEDYSYTKDNMELKAHSIRACCSFKKAK